MSEESELAPSQREWCRKANEAGPGCDVAQIRLMPGEDDGRSGNGEA